MSLNYSYRDLDAAIRKLGPTLEFKAGSGKERVAYVVRDGRRLRRVTFPNRHGGGQSPSKGFLRSVIRDLRIDPEFFRGLVDCPKTLVDYQSRVFGDIARDR